MFNFFKRPGKAQVTAVTRLRSQGKAPARMLGAELRDALPMPQVTEGNEDSDWAMWEDSVLEQDSQMHSQPHDTVPGHFTAERDSEPDADPFSKVSNHAP